LHLNKWETILVEVDNPEASELHKNQDKFYCHFDEIAPQDSAAITEVMGNLAAQLTFQFGKEGPEFDPANQTKSPASNTTPVSSHTFVSVTAPLPSSTIISIQHQSWKIMNSCEITLLEEVTQDNRPLWARARLHKITASNIQNLFKSKTDNSLKKFVCDLSMPANTSNVFKWSEWGHHVEETIFSTCASQFAFSNNYYLQKAYIYFLK
jgi:hypothetical protein